MNDAARTLRAVEEVLRSADLLVEVVGAGDVPVQGLALDSRAARPGDLFLAWEGLRFDAHDFVASAVENGAVATVVEHAVDVDVPQLVVTNGRRAAALASSAVMGAPSRDVLAVGVTGTNGKTTTALLIRHLLSPEVPTAVIGTLGLVDEHGVRPGTEGLTTPGPAQVAIWLRELADGGVGAVVLEASSHALEQHRLDGVEFDIAVFTNLSQDHLDYHGDMGAYRAAKARLVDLVTPGGTLVVNADDPAWAALDAGGRTVRTFSAGSAALDRTDRVATDVSATDVVTTDIVAADLVAVDVVLDTVGTSFALLLDGASHAIRTPLVGRYNVENSLAAIGAALAAGVPAARVVERLATAPQVSGRLESVVTHPFSVLIDFAHTPAALHGALAAVRPLTPGRLIVLFGAGGDRDATKRAPMAEAVRAFADVVVLTSDNPRTEDPEAIIDDVAAGLEGVDYQRIADRREAIAVAIGSARPGDTVILAGKGHESYQVVGTEKQPFDEHEIARRVLRDLGVL
jgi:UDP-N-acetylmuramoyl-L-alanyl-D-glutamate--2,6-diaminopimelate ligase